MRRMRQGDDFGGVAIATGEVQNVVRRSREGTERTTYLMGVAEGVNRTAPHLGS